MNGEENGELKKLAGFVEAGFEGVSRQIEKVNEKLATIERERAFESGFEMKEKVKDTAREIDDLKAWQISAQNTIVSLRRVSWTLGGAVIVQIVSILGYWINSHFVK